MSSLGMYFGPRVISLVETQGKKILKNIQVPQLPASGVDLEGKVQGDARLIRLVALFKDELRKNKITAKEAMLCLSGRELIIRAFEMPALARNELRSAINFEVKKYIPFKVEDMVSDFHVQFNKASRINLVVFVGIKRESLDKYVLLLSHLNMKINTIEYAPFSILRCLKLAGLRNKGITAVVSADLAGEDEANFTVLKDGFPLFSRDFILAGAQDELAGVKEASAPGMAFEKLKTEIRVSLDYYQRKFSESRIEQLYCICNQENRPEVEAFIKEMNLPYHTLDLSKYFGKASTFSLEAVKSFSVSLAKAIPSDLKINILSKRVEKEKSGEAGIQQQLVGFVAGLNINLKIVIFGVVICAATYGYGFYRSFLFQKELNGVIDMRPKLSIVSTESSTEELENVNTEYSSRLRAVNDEIKKQVIVAEALNIIPRLMPEGAWLTAMSFRKDNTTAELILNGRAYTGTVAREFDLVNTLVASLKQDSGFTKIFKDINILSVQQIKEADISIVEFTVSCRSLSR